VYAGPVDGEMNAQTEAALRAYQEKQSLPVSGAADEATLKQLQLELPASRQGESN
jgi:peptidoglycan hydrolase-like protein with peptidoglycan-binding domain